MSYLSDEDLQIASRFLFLSMAMIVIQKDIHLFQNGSFKIKEPYLELLAKMSSRATDERRDLRKKMHKKNMRVISLEKGDLFSSFLFLSKGKEERRNYFNPAIRKKVENILHELMSISLSHYQPEYFREDS